MQMHGQTDVKVEIVMQTFYFVLKCKGHTGVKFEIKITPSEGTAVLKDGRKRMVPFFRPIYPFRLFY